MSNQSSSKCCCKSSGSGDTGSYAAFRQLNSQSIPDGNNVVVNEWWKFSTVNSSIQADPVTGVISGFDEGCYYEVTGHLNFNNPTGSGNSRIDIENGEDLSGLVYQQINRPHNSPYAIRTFKATSNTTVKLLKNGAVAGNTNQFATHMTFRRISCQ